MPAYSKLSPKAAARKKDHSSSGPGKKLTKGERARAMTAFLKAYALCGLRYQACHEAGISPQAVRKWEEKYSWFAEKVACATLIFAESFEKVAIKRAKRKSDTLMVAMLKAYNPKKYNPKLEASLDLGNAPITLVLSQGEMSEADREALKSVSNKPKD